MNPAKDHRNQGSPSGASAGASSLHSPASAEGEACKSETLTPCNCCKKRGAAHVELGMSTCTLPSEYPGYRAPASAVRKVEGVSGPTRYTLRVAFDGMRAPDPEFYQDSYRNMRTMQGHAARQQELQILESMTARQRELRRQAAAEHCEAKAIKRRRDAVSESEPPRQKPDQEAKAQRLEITVEYLKTRERVPPGILGVAVPNLMARAPNRQ